MEGKTCVVTGANSGIGKESAVELARRGARVLMLCRSPERGEAARQEIVQRSGHDAVELVLCDLASLKSVRLAAAKVCEKVERVDVLLNNAGIYLPRRQNSEEGHEATFAINHLGHFELTARLRPALGRGSRVVNVSSAAHKAGRVELDRIDDPPRYKAMRAYCNAKLCNILFTQGLHRRLASEGITANSLHPGAIGSGFAQDEKGAFNALMKVGKPFLLTPAKGARTSVYLCCAPELEGQSGGYYPRSRPARASRQAHDSELAEGLWALSERLVH